MVSEQACGMSLVSLLQPRAGKEPARPNSHGSRWHLLCFSGQERQTTVLLTHTIPPSLFRAFPLLGGGGLGGCNAMTSASELWSFQPNQEGCPSADPGHTHLVAAMCPGDVPVKSREVATSRGAHVDTCSHTRMGGAALLGNGSGVHTFYGSHLLPRSRRADAFPVAALQDAPVISNKRLLWAKQDVRVFI